VNFSLNAESLAFYDINMNYCVEPGIFTIMTGSSSNSKDLKKTILTIDNRIEL
jgi:beta-glucosidase